MNNYQALLFLLNHWPSQVVWICDQVPFAWHLTNVVLDKSGNISPSWQLYAASLVWWVRLKSTSILVMFGGKPQSTVINNRGKGCHKLTDILMLQLGACIAISHKCWSFGVKFWVACFNFHLLASMHRGTPRTIWIVLCPRWLSYCEIAMLIHHKTIIISYQQKLWQ